jgi:cation:H+ antiporter
MEIIKPLVLIVIFLLILVKSAKLIEESFVFVARKLGISEFFIGFVILGVITSLPEIAIAVNASKDPDTVNISIGNLFGGSIILLTLAFGLSVIRFGDFRYRGRFKEHDIFAALAVISLSILLCLDRRLDLIDSVLMIGGYIFYILNYCFRYHRKKMINNDDVMIKATTISRKLFRALIGIILILFAASMLLENAVTLATELGVHESMIGLFLIALGTNVPEITILFTSRTQGEKRLASGNFIGSASINTGILGLLTLSSGGIEINDFEDLIPTLVIMTMTVFIFGFFSWTGKSISKKEGYSLVMLYFLLIFTETYLMMSSQ